MKTALRKLSSAQKLFRRVVRSAPSRPSSAKRSSPHPLSPVITKKRSIANQPTRNYRLVRERKWRQPTHRQRQRGSRPGKEQGPHCLKKPWEGSRCPFSQQSARAADETAPWQIQLQKEQCAPA